MLLRFGRSHVASFPFYFLLFLFFFPSRFISWGMLKGVNDSCYSDNLHMKKRGGGLCLYVCVWGVGGLLFVPKWDLLLFEKKKIKKKEKTGTNAHTAKMTDGWKLKRRLRVFGAFLNGLLITRVLRKHLYFASSTTTLGGLWMYWSHF